MAPERTDDEFCHFICIEENCTENEVSLMRWTAAAVCPSRSGMFCSRSLGQEHVLGEVVRIASTRVCGAPRACNHF